MQELQHLMHRSGIMGPVADSAALGTIRQQIDLDAMAAGFQAGFFYACVCFLIGCVPMFYLFLRRRPHT